MTNFDRLTQIIFEGLKNPKDNPCWKGYKPVGTKKKGGRTVPNCVPKESKKKLTENYFPVRTSFADLPSTAPYGFWVWNNKYVVANYMDDHIKILREIMPSEYQHLGDSSLQSKAYTLGLIRVVKEGSTYHIDYTKGSPTALKLIQDIAEFYGKTVTDPFKQPSRFTELTALNGSQKVTDDTTVTAEGEYAQGQDNIGQPGGYDTIGFKDNGPTFTVEKSQRDKVIDTAINFLEQLKKNGMPLGEEQLSKLLSQLEKMADSLSKVGIEPVDIIATIKDPRKATQYLITGPSAPGGGGKGALQDLKDIKAGLLVDDESNPGGADVTADIENIDYNSYEVKPYLNDPNNGKDQPEGALEEKKSKLDLAIEALTRREFLGKAGQAAKAVAGSSILPTGMLKGTLGATSALGAASKINFDIDKILTNLITLNVEGADIIPTKDFKGTILNNIKFEKKIYGDLFNAIKGNALSIPDDEVHNLGSHVTILGLFQNIITGKATKEEINALDGYFDFEARFGKKRLSLTELKELFEETSMDFNEGEAENLINSVLKDAFNNHQLKPETYKELSLHGYDWYQYVDSPEALRLRKQEAEKIAADNKKQQEEWQKQQKLQQDQEKEKEQAYGSRFDYGGGEQDRAEEPEEWVDTFATDPNNKGNLIWYKNNPGRGRAKPYGGPGTYTVDENFIDKKGPGRPGDSKRHGIKKKASLSSLDKIVKSKTASPRKKQLAHWQANMRRGKAKKKE